MNTWRPSEQSYIGRIEWSSLKYLWKLVEDRNVTWQVCAGLGARENDLTLFPFADYWWFYAGFTVFVVAMLAVDLGVFHRRAHDVSAREAARWSAVWITLALVFNVLLHQFTAARFGADIGSRIALEFLAGYVVEYTLSIDNMFVFVVILSFFSVPSALQHRVLFYGIVGALLCRAVFIALGSVLLSYQAVVVLFGVVLMLTGARMFWRDAANASPDRSSGRPTRIRRRSRTACARRTTS